MVRTGSLPRESSDTWKYALVGGLAAVPPTTATYLQTGSELSLTPVLFGGVLAGYLAKRKTGTAQGVGFRAGVVGALPVLLLLVDVTSAMSALDGPTWFLAVATLATAGSVLVFTVAAFGLAGIVGAVGGRVGGWIADARGPRRRPAARG